MFEKGWKDRVAKCYHSWHTATACINLEELKDAVNDNLGAFWCPLGYKKLKTTEQVINHWTGAQ